MCRVLTFDASDRESWELPVFSGLALEYLSLVCCNVIISLFPFGQKVDSVKSEETFMAIEESAEFNPVCSYACSLEWGFLTFWHWEICFSWVLLREGKARYL